MDLIHYHDGTARYVGEDGHVYLHTSSDIADRSRAVGEQILEVMPYYDYDELSLSEIRYLGALALSGEDIDDSIPGLPAPRYRGEVRATLRLAYLVDRALQTPLVPVSGSAYTDLAVEGRRMLETAGDVTDDEMERITDEMCARLALSSRIGGDAYSLAWATYISF